MEMFVSCSKLGNTVKCFWNQRLYLMLTADLRKLVAISGLCSVVMMQEYCSTTRQGNLESVLFIRNESVVNFWCSRILYYGYHLVPCRSTFDLIHEDRCWVNEKLYGVRFKFDWQCLPMWLGQYYTSTQNASANPHIKHSPFSFK